MEAATAAEIATTGESPVEELEVEPPVEELQEEEEAPPQPSRRERRRAAAEAKEKQRKPERKPARPQRKPARQERKREPRSRGRVINFFIQVWAELRRVQWPNRSQVTQATGVVIVFCFIAGGYLAIWDFLFNKLIKAIL
jgi:preprotein translocase SecE subunit